MAENVFTSSHSQSSILTSQMAPNFSNIFQNPAISSSILACSQLASNFLLNQSQFDLSRFLLESYLKTIFDCQRTQITQSAAITGLSLNWPTPSLAEFQIPFLLNGAGNADSTRSNQFGVELDKIKLVRLKTLELRY